MNNKHKCPHYSSLGENHRHYLNEPKYSNCLLCLVIEEGPIPQARIAEYLGLSKMRVSQIQRHAIRKVEKLLELDDKMLTLKN